MSKQQSITVKGEVLEALGNANFKVKLENELEIICYLAGKIRMNMINILVGDVVIIEMSPYDLTKGRITRRLANSTIKKDI